jgi:hypothetical protein
MFFGYTIGHEEEWGMTRADAPKVLGYNWGGNDIRWKLEAFGGGTRLVNLRLSLHRQPLFEDGQWTAMVGRKSTIRFCSPLSKSF